MSGAEPASLVRQAEDLCRERRLRLTRQRRRVLEILCASPRPMGAYQILDALRDEAIGSAPPTVYRALDFLLEHGLIHKIETLHAFVGCAHPGQPHPCQLLICAGCGGVDELTDEAIQRSLGRAAEQIGFTPQRRVVELIGTCGHCQRAPALAEPPGRQGVGAAARTPAGQSTPRWTRGGRR